ncbi:Lrp/AsnC family transcriptional regulator [Methylovirgula sp. 4M-Z18]|uniref:Lrp/AsnC family transcriptional regulator n=2 Tax=Methylovirgula sp. 4M-Z18 TaxID=2293567 RepID=UPI00247A1951|nr:Lrp/AsnC family transcriptional regulator [Methylovirgula sp. 4M-Z18]
MDSVDLMILDALQSDGRMTNVDLARRVGISPPPCLRRVRALEEAGVIQGYRALVDAKSVGYGIVSFAFVHLEIQSEPELAAFAARIKSWKNVRESWTLSGDIDFILKCISPDMAAFQAFVGELTAVPNVRNVRTSLALTKIKDEPLAAIDTAGRGDLP